MSDAPDNEDSNGSKPAGRRRGEPREAAMGFIFITLLIDIIGIGIVIPVLPKLIEQMAGGDVSLAGW